MHSVYLFTLHCRSSIYLHRLVLGTVQLLMLFIIYYIIYDSICNIILRYIHTLCILYIYIYSAKNLLYLCEPIHSRFPRVFLHTLCIDRDACSTIKRPKRVCQVLLCVVQFRFFIFLLFRFWRIKKRFSNARESDRGDSRRRAERRTLYLYDMTQYHVYKIIYRQVYIYIYMQVLLAVRENNDKDDNIL